MSRRTAEASKAVRDAWKEEQERVRMGKGTRDWTKEQQKEILEYGRAYYHSDDPNDIYDGKAFEGHHMKSVKAYPEFQGDSANIQFLSKPEHKEAHRGNYKNASNWYYDPVTHEFTDFGEGKYTPCTVIDLSHPIIIVNIDKEKTESAETKPHKKTTPAEERNTTTSSKRLEEKPEHKESEPPKKESKKASTPNTTTTKHERKTGIWSHAKGSLDKALSTIFSGVKSAVKENKEQIIIAFLGIITTTIVNKKRSGSDRTGYTSPSALTGSSTGSSDYKSNPQLQCDIPDEGSMRNSPREHEVSEHSQRYHTKYGVEWREKKSYPRGGNKSNDN